MGANVPEHRQRKPKVLYRGAKNSLNDGRQYTKEQIDFMLAMDKYKNKIGRQLTNKDIFYVATILLGYVRYDT